MGACLPRLCVLPVVSKSGRRAFSLMEVLCAMAVMAALGLISMVCLLQVSTVWRKTSARDTAMRQLLKAEAELQRDLANVSRAPGQSRFAPIRAGSGGVDTSDGLALLVPDPAQEGLRMTPSGSALLSRAVTYYLAIPPNLEAQTGLPANFAADANGYEAQCAFKWLIRKEEAAPVDGAGGLALPAAWLTGGVIEIPDQMWRQPERRVVAINLLGMRVLQGSPLWEIQLSAVAIDDARRKLALGTVPLSSTAFVVWHRVAVVARH